MALFDCPDCGRQVSDSAEACIHCGRPAKKHNVEAISALYCKACLKDGKNISLLPSVKKETSWPVAFVAATLIIIGIPGIFFWGSGLFLILIAILIVSLGKTEKKTLRCPECNNERIFE